MLPAAVIALVQVVGALFPAAAVAAESRPLPWTGLEFAKSYLWVNASADLSLRPVASAEAAPAWLEPPEGSPLCPESEILWELSVSSNVASNREQVTVWLDPMDLRVYQRSRMSHGRDRRLKLYRYLEQGVYRIRREAAGEQNALPPESWPESTPLLLPYPRGLPANAPVTTPYVLFAAASIAPLDAPGDTWSQYLHTDMDFLRLDFAVTGREVIAVDYILERGGSGERITGSVTALVIALRLRTLGEAPPEDEFELMGLTGAVSILVDPETRLPLQVRGRAPRLGNTAIDLVRAGVAAAGTENPP